MKKRQRNKNNKKINLIGCKSKNLFVKTCGFVRTMDVPLFPQVQISDPVGMKFFKYE